MDVMKLLRLAAVVTGALLLAAAAVGVGLLVKRLLESARHKGHYFCVHTAEYCIL